MGSNASLYKQLRLHVYGSSKKMNVKKEDDNEDPLTIIRAELALEVRKQVESNAISHFTPLSSIYSN